MSFSTTRVAATAVAAAAAVAVVVVVAPMAAEPGVSFEGAGVAIESPGTWVSLCHGRQWLPGAAAAAAAAVATGCDGAAATAGDGAVTAVASAMRMMPVGCCPAAGRGRAGWHFAARQRQWLLGEAPMQVWEARPRLESQMTRQPAAAVPAAAPVAPMQVRTLGWEARPLLESQMTRQPAWPPPMAGPPMAGPPVPKPTANELGRFPRSHRTCTCMSTRRLLRLLPSSCNRIELKMLRMDILWILLLPITRFSEKT